jgi:hypothetical protein
MPCNVLEIMKMETAGSCEILLYIHQTMWLPIYIDIYVHIRYDLLRPHTAVPATRYETSHLT